MVQAIAEGVDLLTRSDYPLDLPALFHNWSHGSVIRGWLVELMERGLREQTLEKLSGYVEDTREVKWVVEYALEEAWIPVNSPILAAASGPWPADVPENRPPGSFDAPTPHFPVAQTEPPAVLPGLPLGSPPGN